MKSDINLTTEVRRERRTIAIITLIIGGCFGICVLASIVLALVSISVNSQVSALDKEGNGLRSQISSFARQKETLLLTNDRLGNIKRVLADRKTINLKMNTISSVIPGSFSFEEIKVNDEEVRMRVASPTLSDFDSLIEEKIPLLTKNKELGIKSIEVGTFTHTEDDYELSLIFSFTNAKKK